jgi:RNA polymerase sigma-70 factor, ECF subfamily
MAGPTHVQRLVALIAPMSSGLRRGRSHMTLTQDSGIQTRGYAARMTEVTDTGLDAALERYRRELTAHCYRMLGSSFEAEDAVQETLVRAWRGYDGFEGRSALRSWLYRIATNVCLDMLNGRNRRARPMDLASPSPADSPVGATLPETEWVLPVPDGRVLAAEGDPAELAEARETIRLAFIAALQHLPPRQRAVLLLRDVVRWKATEVAELLDTTDASVNSALQRARATIAASNISDTDPAMPMDEEQQELLSRYVDAFERYDMESLTALIHEDATQSMPPYEMWLRGRDEIITFWQGQGAACAGSRLLPTVANGKPAFGQYRPRPAGPGHDAWALQVLDFVDGRLVELSWFLDTERLFPLFGLPAHLES